MKKILFILLVTVLTFALHAIDLQWDGEFRTRGAVYNGNNGTPGGHIDNRLRLGFSTELHPALSLRAKFEMGKSGGWENTIWGDDGGFISTNGVNVKTNEAYIDYRVEQIRTRFRLGQQYWADHRSLILDDNFSGLTAEMELGEDKTAMLGFIKYLEGQRYDRYDDYQGFVFSFDMKQPLESGIQGFANWHRTKPFGHKPVCLKDFILMPYAAMEFSPINLDAVLYYQYSEDFNVLNNKVESTHGYGTALKAEAQFDALGIRADILYNADNNLLPLSEFYQNGLYLFGIGEHNEDLCRWWRLTGADDYLALTLGANYQILENLKAFGNLGFIPKAGTELNGGVEIVLVPDLLKLAAFGAYGIVSDDFGFSNKNGYALGSTIKLEF